MPDGNNTPNTPGDAEPQGTVNTPAAPQTQDPKPTDNTTVNNGLTEAEIATRLEKARADEKKKAFGKIDALSKEKQELADRYKKAEEELAAARENLNQLREGKSSEVDSLQRELNEMRTRSEKLEKAIETVATEAAARIQRSEVNAYREKVIREQNIELAELVTGSTIEEVDSSVQAALDREKQLRAKFLQGAQGSTVSVEQKQTSGAPVTPEVKPKPDTSNLPRPINPDGSQGRDLLGDLTPLNREHLAKLPKDQYLKRRDELLRIAKEKSGLLT